MALAGRVDTLDGSELVAVESGGLDARSAGAVGFEGWRRAMSAITPEKYERAVELANGSAVEGELPVQAHLFALLARALLHVHAQRRTPGTVEVCAGPGDWICGNDLGRAELCESDRCPIRAGRTEK